MAAVYRAEQDLSRGITRPVAVKVIRPEYSESEDFREMFLDEARTACTLSHPNIVHIYEVGETDDGSLFMAMELVSGETLSTVNRTLRDNDERFSDQALFSIGILTCSALEAVHALKVEGGVANLVHRDVSPHNLLLSTSGSLKLIDFGIAKAATNRNLTMPGVTKGKAGYFSPEQAMGKKLDGRSDLFSLGITLYKLASGGTPFDDYKNHAERHAALVRGQWEDLESVYPGLPTGLYEVVRRSLALKPDDRYQTAREMREALEKAAFDSQVRVGQSSLQGYLDEEGEVTAEGGGRAPAAPGVSNGPSLTMKSPIELKTAPPSATSMRDIEPHKTDRLIPAAGKPAPSRRWMLMGAFAAAVLLGVGAVALALAMNAPPPPPEPVKVVAPKVIPKPQPVVVAEPPKMVVDVGEETVTIDPEPVAVKPTAPTVPVRPKNPPVVAVRPPPPVKEAPVVAPVKEPVTAVSTDGEGKLSVNVTGSGVYTVLINGKVMGTTPTTLTHLRSGVMSLLVKDASGLTARKQVTLQPDGYERVSFSPADFK